MDWGDALFCLLAFLLAIGIFRVSADIRRLTAAVEKLGAGALKDRT